MGLGKGKEREARRIFSRVSKLWVWGKRRKGKLAGFVPGVGKYGLGKGKEGKRKEKRGKEW